VISSIFRKYDIRGKVDIDFKISDIYPISLAIATYFKQHQPLTKTVALGMDGRVHSPAIKAQVTQALLDSDLEVLFIGVCSSPALYFATHQLPVQAGIMITASHNPKAYNGLKLVLNRETLWDTQITEIRDLYLKIASENSLTRDKLSESAEVSELAGVTDSNYREQDIIEQYIDYLAEQFKHLKNSELKFALDCGNGAACTVVPKLIQKLNWPNVKLLCAELDGNFPNHQADPTQLANMLDLQQALMLDPELEFGAGLDGDVDRVGLMTKFGALVPNDKLLTIFAKSLSGTIKNLTIVGDIKYSANLKNYLNNLGVKTVLAPCGVAFIKNSMRQHQALLGGELSGHFCFFDRYLGYDDGLYALLRFCEILISENTNLTKLLSQLPTTVYSPEIRIHCRPEQKEFIVNHTKTILARRTDLNIIDIDGVRSESAAGWGGIRASNTEDVLSIRFEAQSAAALREITTDYYEILKEFFDEKTLKTDLNL
jgi:phosphomannomutase/phosphoglucomutase